MAAQEAVPIVAIGSQVEISLVGLEAWSTRSFSPTTSTSPDGPSSSKKSSTLKLRHIARISNEIEVVVAVVIPQLLRDNVISRAGYMRVEFKRQWDLMRGLLSRLEDGLTIGNIGLFSRQFWAKQLWLTEIVNPYSIFIQGYELWFL
ncbi:hypothetical protein ZEAMMB73_Zm00001d000455 [Zea mays]|nr:hypothetical protein ZEAMMB73_Zm00001d000455 [Zea mays]